MQTECSTELFEFAPVEKKPVVASFDGGRITSDSGGLLLGRTDRKLGLTRRLAGCFTDVRDRRMVEHEVETLLKQRIFGIALGYEDLNDHDEWRHDPVLAAMIGKLEAKRKDCAAAAGKSTLNRLELSLSEPSRYHKIAHDGAAIENLFIDLFLESRAQPPGEIILDLDATDDPVHGKQEGRFFHGYYDSYCYLPLYIFCGDQLLASKLQPANIDASAGTVEELDRIVPRIRACWPQTRIVIRADSGFQREEIMKWCESNGVHYVLGVAKNKRLVREIERELAEAKEESEASGQPARRFREFMWTTRQSWSRRRRVIGKAEWTGGEANPRFIVTSLTEAEGYGGGRALYEETYCARGEMENRIKECQLDLFADRTSTATLRANQLRLWLASMAYVLVESLRRLALSSTRLSQATCGTIRRKLFKIGALVTVSVRRIKIACASACPYKDVFAAAYAALDSC